MASVSDVIDAAGFANDATRIGFLTTFFRQQNASWKRQQASDKQYAVASAAHRKEEEQIWTTWRAARDQCEFDYGHCTAGWTACQDQRIECVTAADEARDAALRALEAQKRAATEPWGDSLSNESQKRRELFEAMLVAWDASGARYATLVEGAGRGLHPPDPAFVGVSRARCLGAPQEMIPDRVYVGPPFDRQKAPEGFVDAAVKFHQKDWGLTVTKPNSLSKLIEDLAKQSGVHRVRLVAHGMPHVAGEDSALNLAIFPKAETWLGREALEALAASDIAIVEYMAQLTSFVKRRVPPAARRIAKEIPDRFGRLNLANRSSDLEAFMVYVAILAQKDVFDKVDVSARKDLKSAVQLLSELYHAKLVESGIAKKDLDALAESIRSATASASMLTQLSVTKREEGEQPLRQCLVAVKAGLRKNIEAARRALGGSAYFDLRGCELGENPAHILAPWARLFGLPEGNVSGPRQLVGFLASDPPTPVFGVLEGLGTDSTPAEWIQQTIATEAIRLEIDDDWIVGPSGTKFVTWAKADAKVRLLKFCEVAMAVVAEDYGTVRLAVGQEHGDSTAALKAVIRSIWANPPSSQVDSIVRKWKGGTLPTFPTIVLPLSKRDAFPWQPIFSAQIARGDQT